MVSRVCLPFLPFFPWLTASFLLLLPGIQPRFIAKSISKWLSFAVQVYGDKLQSAVGISSIHWTQLSKWATASLLDENMPIVASAIVSMLAALTSSGQRLNPWSEPRSSNIGEVILGCVEDKVCDALTRKNGPAPTRVT